MGTNWKHVAAALVAPAVAGSGSRSMMSQQNAWNQLKAEWESLQRPHAGLRATRKASIGDTPSGIALNRLAILARQ